MRELGRRALLRLGALAFGGSVAGCAEDPVLGRPVPMGRFRHGVASGDPEPDRVQLWTHLADADGDEAVELILARDEALADRVLTADLVARAETGHTLQVQAEGLEAGRDYYYRFRAGDEASVVGRTRTAPVLGPVRLAFTCCGSYAHGFFHTYRRIAERPAVDAVVHLGDYIYEYGDGGYGDLRGYDPPYEVLTLADYRRRYAHYRLDPDVALLHARHPLIVTWDDHELANNAWRGGAIEHDPATEGDWSARVAAASRAYAEWLPRREQLEGSLYRRLPFGEMVDLFVLDTRLEGRDGPPASDAEAASPDRTMLGAAQREAFLADLRASTARWKVVAHSVQLSPHHQGFWNHDAWDGYAAERDALLRLIDAEALEGVVFVCGDGHKSFADDLPVDPFDPDAYDPETGRGSVAVELMTPAATSPNAFGQAARDFEARVLATSPHTRFVDAESRGYWVLTFDEARADMELTFVHGVEDPLGGEETLGARFEVRAGERFLRRLG